VLVHDGATTGAAAVEAAFRAAGGDVEHRTLTEVLTGLAPPWSGAATGIVVIGADPPDGDDRGDVGDLAEVVGCVRRHDRDVPVVVLATRPDGDLLVHLLRAGGRNGCGLRGDDAVELLGRAARTPGCATSPRMAAALLDRLGRSSRDHDLELVRVLLAGGDRDGFVEEVAGRPDLLAAVVDDAAGRALKRLALAAPAEDRAWLALVHRR
jgi:hypothetical protein